LYALFRPTLDRLAITAEILQAATLKACLKPVDSCYAEVGYLQLTLWPNGYTTLVIADHGNCETMDQSGREGPIRHTTNPVPLILLR